MTDSKSDGHEAKAPGARCPWTQHVILGGVCALVIGVYAVTARSGYLVSWSPNAADNYYNLLVQGFRAGQLNLKIAVPPGLAQLADPYDPSANSRYGLLDMSYYKGKLYLYFGVTPAVLLFWPYAVLTGHYVLQKDAALMFCLVGFLTGVGLLRALWRRYFAEVSVWVVAAGALALGLATCTPSLLGRCDVWEVSISCGYALTMLALAAVWKALHESTRRGRWLAAASLAYGLAVGARPNLLFGAVILLVPVIQAWRERRPVLAPLLAATAPMMLIGLGLMLYNALRFDNPFELGWRYQLAGIHQETGHLFQPRCLWFNFRIYFLEPARWSSRFPFVHDIRVPALPVGHVGALEHPFGVLTNIPLVWLALAVPLGWRGRSVEARSALCGFLAAVTALFGVVALTISLLVFAQGRYEMEFLPALVLLAVIGILSVERALAPTSESGQAGRPVRRRAARWGWGLLLVFSVGFNLLASIERCAEAHNNLGRALQETGRVQEAIGQYSQALHLNPDYAEPHNNLGVVLMRQGRRGEAIGQYEQALRLEPDDVLAHVNLGIALRQEGRLQEAIGHYERALRIAPDSADAHYNLGNALIQSGRVPEAIEHWQRALQINPDLAETHCNLGVVLEKLGRRPEAIRHYEQALRIKPDYVEARDALTRARAAP
jgi:tetratricopeptide (TPR) repeat protein